MSTNYHHFLLKSATVVKHEGKANESDPALDEKVLDRDLNFELAQEISGPQDKVEHTRMFSCYTSLKKGSGWRHCQVAKQARQELSNQVVSYTRHQTSTYCNR